MKDEYLDKTVGGFSALDLDVRLQRALTKLGFQHPTLVQSNGIPLALSGKDILARARTGSGKTAAYCLPVIQRILQAKVRDLLNADPQPMLRALILVPTRELAEQVTRHIQDLTMYCNKEITALNLALADKAQKTVVPVLREKPDIVVTTPSKILSHVDTKHVSLGSVESLVIDEADLILSYGYDADVSNILKQMPKQYQSYLMSATLSQDVQKLKQLVLRNPAVLKLEEAEAEEDLLTQYFVKTKNEKDKFLLLYFILKLRVHPFGSGKCIIFVNDIDRGYQVKLFLEQFGIKSCTLNAEMPVRSRYHIVNEFNRGIYEYIVATDDMGSAVGANGLAEGSDDEDDENNEDGDVANGNDDDEEKGEDSEAVAGSKRKRGADSGPQKAKKSKMFNKDHEFGVSRGIDFTFVQSVINFDLPRSARGYTHRVGRTARGVGNRGWALSFVTDEDGNIGVKTMVKKGANGQKKVVLVTDEEVFERIRKKQEDVGREITPYTFDMEQVEAFRYRCEGALRSVTKSAIKDARLKEIKNELLNSEKLKAHFEDNPQDLQALRHDLPIHSHRVQPELKHIPTYLMPKKKPGSNEEATEENGPRVRQVPFKKDGRRKRGGGRPPIGGAARKKADPLKSFSYKSK
ncbi:P-loop containing nucleoside triphosphate hydrolase protein [Cladochytrium replicatum]|nr:P-loop containing nucleoside triphosphate hydrolase protein [Cladochytrium replicatum]